MNGKKATMMRQIAASAYDSTETTYQETNVRFRLMHNGKFTVDREPELVRVRTATVVMAPDQLRIYYKVLKRMWNALTKKQKEQASLFPARSKA